MNSEFTYKVFITGFVIIAASLLIFTRLGNYALWDDEATTALFGQAVWQTGDSVGQLDHNIIAYNSGIELKDLRNRVIPPLPFYMAAPFVGMAPGSALAARLPFAICGILTVMMVLLWLWRSKVSLSIFSLTAVGFLTHVSFFLYARQCRYYAPVILFTVILAYTYSFRDNKKNWAIIFSICSILLLAANYLCYAGVMFCFLIDYLIWGRRDKSIQKSSWVMFIGTQLILGGILLSIYNPLGINLWHITRQSWLKEKGGLFWWNWRDLNSCEFGVGIMLLLVPFLGYCTKQRLLVRCFCALFTYILVVSILSPQPLALLSVAFVRYLVPVIPVCILMAVLCVNIVWGHSKVLAILVAFLAFGTNVLHGGPLVGTDSKTVFSFVISKGSFRSTITEYVKELIHPPRSAYARTAEWINQNVDEGQSIWIAPGYANYPLMYHAPKALYAWQLQKDEAQFKGLPDMHFKGRGTPDYLIAFGPHIYEIKEYIQESAKAGINYVQVKQVELYWYDLTRPELFWHAFQEVDHHSPVSQEIYIYAKEDK